jgi:hypothetical protein
MEHVITKPEELMSSLLRAGARQARREHLTLERWLDVVALAWRASVSRQLDSLPARVALARRCWTETEGQP